jgi:hypothetical protein
MEMEWKDLPAGHWSITRNSLGLHELNRKYMGYEGFINLPTPWSDKDLADAVGKIMTRWNYTIAEENLKNGYDIKLTPGKDAAGNE